MAQRDISWNTFAWNVSDASGYFGWTDVSGGDVSGNTTPVTDASGDYMLKQVNNNLNLIIIDGSGSYSDTGDIIKSNSYEIDYFNHVTTTEQIRKYKLYHNFFDLNMEFEIPFQGYFDSPTNVYFNVKGYNGQEENRTANPPLVHITTDIDGHFKWSISDKVYENPGNPDPSNTATFNKIEYIFVVNKNINATHSFINSDNISYDQGDVNPEYLAPGEDWVDISDNIYPQGETYITFTVNSSNSEATLPVAGGDYPEGTTLIADDGNKTIKMKYPNNPWRDKSYIIRSIEPYYSFPTTIYYPAIIYDWPSAPVLWHTGVDGVDDGGLHGYGDGVEVLQNYSDGALVKYKWRAGIVKNWQDHGQLKGPGGVKAEWDKKGKLISTAAQATSGAPWQKMEDTFGNQKIQYTIGSLNSSFNRPRGGAEKAVLKNLEFDEELGPYIEIKIHVGLGTTQAYIYSTSTVGGVAFFSPRTYISINIDPLGDWKCTLLPPTGPSDSQNSTDPQATHTMTRKEEWAAIVKGRRFCR